LINEDIIFKGESWQHILKPIVVKLLMNLTMIVPRWVYYMYGEQGVKDINKKATYQAISDGNVSNDFQLSEIQGGISCFNIAGDFYMKLAILQV
jgi:hypothetical protein